MADLHHWTLNMYTRQVGMIELKTLRSWLISYKRVSLLMMELAVAFCCQTDKKREREGAYG